MNNDKLKHYIDGVLVVLLILGISAVGAWFRYNLTRAALIDLTGKEPKPGTVIAIMMNGGK